MESLDPERIFNAYALDAGQDMFEYMGFLLAIGRGIVLEIGVRGGVSTSAFLLSAAKHVYSVDIDPACGALYAGNPKWTFVHSDSRDAERVQRYTLLEPGWVDVLFIDGDHSYEGLHADLENYSGLMGPGGLILVHDVSPLNSMSLTPEQVAGGWAGPYTSRAWNQFIGEHKLLMRSGVLPGKFGMGWIQL